jgi:nucleoside phosphorylase
VGHVTILIATGLRREARLMAGPGVTVIAGGGDAARLERELEMLAGSASAILSSGLAGALDPSLKVGDVVIGEYCDSLPSPVRVERSRDPFSSEAEKTPRLRSAAPLHFARGERGKQTLAEKVAGLLPDAHQGFVAGSAMPLSTAAGKVSLFSQTGALAVDMESHIAARVAARHGLPFAALRVISDAADTTLPPAALAGMRPDGGIAIGAVLASLVRNPAQLPALIRTARDAEKAFQALGRVHDALRGFGIGPLDPGQLALDMA